MPKCTWTALLLVAASAAGGELDDFHWREDFADAGRWTPQPSWLSNASPTASVSSDAGVACFRVDEPGRSMKWSAATMPAVTLEQSPWLVLRYRAENIAADSADYLIYLDDGVRRRQLSPVRLRDVVCDGRWHVVAVDLAAITPAEAVGGLAVQVHAAAKGGARLWLDWLTFASRPPAGATVLRRAPLVKSPAEWIVPLAKATWTAQRSWLSNPAAAGEHSVIRSGAATRVRVSAAGCGTKWSWSLPQGVEIADHRYVSMRYRAEGLVPIGGYTVCILGKPRDAGVGYTAVVPPAAIVADGRWHTLNLDIRAAARRFPKITALAVQVQAATPHAALEAADIRFVHAPRLSRLTDAVDWLPGAKFTDYKAVDISAAARSGSPPWRRHLGLADWFTAPSVTVHGVPFALPEGKTDLAATSVRGTSDLTIPADVSTGEVCILLLAAFVGQDEPVHGGGRFTAIRDVDRFRLRLEYADGPADECLPMNAATGRFGIVSGPQVVVASADASRRLKAVVVCDRCDQAAFAVAAVSARTAAGRRFHQARQDSPPLRHRPRAARRQPAVVKLVKPTHAAVTSTFMDARIRVDRLPALEKLVHRPTGYGCIRTPSPLVRLVVDGNVVAPEKCTLTAAAGDNPVVLTYDTSAGVRVTVSLAAAGPDGLRIAVKVFNRGDKPRRVAVTAPHVGPYRLSDRGEDAWYLLPKRGAAFDNRPCTYRRRYSGLMPLQFVDTFSPAHGRGLTIQTEDRRCIRKEYLLTKAGGEFTIGVAYGERTLQPGETFTTPQAHLRLTDGHWRRGLDAYRRWLDTWHAPLSPRKQWFREVFNFRQRFLHWLDPLYDAQAGAYHLQRAVDEARAEFGGIDYLHIFDWGRCGKFGRIYGRTGDHSPWDYLKGGRAAFADAIAALRKQGLPVGLYIEGYLLEERGKLGGKFGKKWQLIGADGRGMYWPGCTEMVVCPGVSAWREIQASTYATKVGELGVDGMYIDQFGFAGRGKDCHAKDHGHAVPSYAVVTERDCTRIIRRRIDAARKGVAVYTEESPVDVTSQYQDGSFTYAMNESHRTRTRVPINLFRFAIPTFKTIEILYCDKPTGSWATGVKWVFFNGEAIWLEGPAKTWFRPATRRAIRQCYAILRKHRDAFTTRQPVPLVATELGGVFANAFPTAGKTVYTLYNARHRTVRGELLRIPHRQGATYYDEWHARPATIRRDGGDAIIALDLGPHDVGCLVVTHPR